jgi:hypothetical protein
MKTVFIAWMYFVVTAILILLLYSSLYQESTCLVLIPRMERFVTIDKMVVCIFIIFIISTPFIRLSLLVYLVFLSGDVIILLRLFLLSWEEKWPLLAESCPSLQRVPLISFALEMAFPFFFFLKKNWYHTHADTLTHAHWHTHILSFFSSSSSRFE